MVRGMRFRIAACGGLGRPCGVDFRRLVRLCIHGGRRMVDWWVESRMGWSGDRSFHGRSPGGLVGWEKCNMVRLIRFHRGGERGEAEVWD